MDYFPGSIAQEDVQFVTELVQETVVGGNYSNLMVFIEKTKYILDPSVFVTIEGDISMATVTADNYALVVKGKLLTWLNDFFAAQNTQKVYLFTVCASLTLEADYDATVKEDLASTFAAYKSLAYFKTVLLTIGATDVLIADACADVAELCGADTLLSSPVMLPYTTTTPGTTSSDPVYVAVKAVTTGSAFFVCHYDDERNGALLALSLALSVVNGSGTAVGNSFDFVSTLLIDSSGAAGTALSVAVQETLKAANISYFKYVGEETGAVALYGAETISGTVIPADWIVKYCNYVNKVLVAKYITKMNTYRNNQTYQGILLIMSKTVNKFTASSGSGRLSNFIVTAPAFEKLPVSGSTITVPNAWTAVYVDNVRKVEVYGQLTIAA